MKRKLNMIGWIASAALLVAVAWGGWMAGLRAGKQENGVATTGAPTAVSTVDPSTWSIAQGEEATRRHVRDGLKAGDMDPQTGKRILNYHDPMVPGKHFEAPGKSPFMDMMLVPRYAGIDGGDMGSVTVSPRIQQNLGLRTATVMEGTLEPDLTAVGNIAWNERDQTMITSRAMGFVEKLHVRATLDAVRRGAPLADLHVPDWVAVQEDYLAITRMQGGGLETLREAALQRMRQLGMSEEQIRTVAERGRVQTRTTLHAPQTGVLAELLVREGATVSPGMPLMRLQGTSTVWAEAQVPESQGAQLRPGLLVTVTSPALPGQALQARLQAVLPAVDPSTRTVKARVELPNPGGQLVPGLFVQMRFALPVGNRQLLVPSDAVIQTGQRSVVMLAEENGRFRPVEVLVGRETGDQTEVVEGLQAGQRVVRSGQFLIDSEASLRGLEARLNQATDTSPAGTQRHSTLADIKALTTDTVTLSHPPVASLKWPAMTMDFKLPPREGMPPGLSVGDKVRIEFEMQEGDVPRITGMQRLAPGAQR